MPQWTNTSWSPEVVVVNKGPIKAVSVYFSYSVFGVDTNIWFPFAGAGVVEPIHGDYSFVIPELEVGQGKVRSILGIGPTALYEVELSYFHPNDMTKFTKKELFLYESGIYYSENEFKQRDYYNFLMQNLDASKRKKPPQLPPGKSMPSRENLQNGYLLFVPDDKEVLRALD